MVDHRLHGWLHFGASRRRDFAVVRHHWPFAAGRVQLLAALSHDLYRLAHLFHADHIAIVAVAVLADGNIEIHLLVAFVGLRLAQVPWRARATHHDAGETPRPGVRQLDHADVDVALLEDAVTRKQNLHIVADLEEGITEGLNVVDEFARQILVDAAGEEVARVHARPAGAFVEDHQPLALLESPENRRQRADVHRLGRDLQEMRKEAADLAIKDTDKLGPSRNRDAEQPLDRERICVLLIHRRDIVEPIEIGHVLQVGARLHELFSAAMQEADMRVDPLDHLAVELEHQAQHAMRSRMLRPEVDREVAEVLLVHDPDPAAGGLMPTLVFRPLIPRQRRGFPGAQEIELTEFLIEAHWLVAHALLRIVIAHLNETGHREVLAQRITIKAVVGQDAPQIRMTVKQHAKQVVNLTLVPVSARIDGSRAHDRRVDVGRDLDPDPTVQLRRQQMIDDVEALLALRMIDPRNIDDRNELSVRIVAQELERLQYTCGIDS